LIDVKSEIPDRIPEIRTSINILYPMQTKNQFEYLTFPFQDGHCQEPEETRDGHNDSLSNWQQDAIAVDMRQQLVKRVKQEFKELAEAHASVPEDDFNEDTRYRHLTTEAINAKATALKKISDGFSVFLARRSDTDLIYQIMDRPFLDFADESAVMELRTGLVDFPWREVAQKRALVDFGRWTPSGVDPAALALVVDALAANNQLRAVRMCGHEAVLGCGWASAEVLWDKNKAVQASFSAAMLLLRNCYCVTCLSLRFVMCLQTCHLALDMFSFFRCCVFGAFSCLWVWRARLFESKPDFSCC
jgi:hypothetical protein